MALGDSPICLRPGCGKRAKDARVFCHDDWMALPGAMRHKIGKLYTSSRRGHWSNPRQGQWRKTIEGAIALLDPATATESPPVIPPPDTARVREDSKPPVEPEIDDAARIAHQELNKSKPKTKRSFARADIALRGEISTRLLELKPEQLRRVAKDSGLSITTIRDVASQRTPTTQKVAIAIRSVLPDLEVAAKESNDGEIRWLRYIADRFMEGKSYPSAEEAFMAALELDEEEE